MPYDSFHAVKLYVSLSRIRRRSMNVINSRRGPTMAILVLLTLAVSVLYRPGAGASEEQRVVHVRARIRAPNGAAYGGCFGILGGQTKDVLIAGRTDNLGEIELDLSIPTGTTSLILLADSGGMARNSRGRDWEEDPGSGRYDLRLDCWWSPRWMTFGIETPAGLLERCGLPHRELLFNDRSTHIDTVALEKTLGPGRDIDFGTVRFVYAHPLAEVRLDLRDSEGAPFTRPVMLGGFGPARERPSLTNVYDHAVLAQRGSEVRILLTSGGRRLLAADPAGFLVLEERDLAGDPIIVSLPKDVKRGASRIRFEVNVDAVRGDPEKYRDRRFPAKPDYWWIGTKWFL